MNEHEKISYIELPARNIQATKTFFNQAFGWEFTDFGPDYAAFSSQGIEGGFYSADLASISSEGAALVIFYSQNLAATQAKIEQAGGMIIKPAFDFPGGQRFHFVEPSGNEFAVWSDVVIN